jgi:hypothetical protein
MEVIYAQKKGPVAERLGPKPGGRR